jgi:hypothetical protein
VCVAGPEGFLQRLVDRRAPPLGRRDVPHAEREIRPRESAHHLRRVGAEPELRDDVVAHHGRRGCGAREHQAAGNRTEERADLAVLGPEVVPPLADAVRFVDGDEGAAEILDEAAESGEGESLGGDVDELVFTGTDPIEPRVDLVGIERAR